jgi:hypothetical protein
VFPVASALYRHFLKIYSVASFCTVFCYCRVLWLVEVSHVRSLHLACMLYSVYPKHTSPIHTECGICLACFIPGHSSPASTCWFSSWPNSTLSYCFILVKQSAGVGTSLLHVHVWYCRVCGDFMRQGLDWQLDLLDWTQLHNSWLHLTVHCKTHAH